MYSFTHLDDLRQPEYTGENRCVPCTVTNVAIAAVLSLLVGLVLPVAGLAAFGLSLATIYLRGYLVPGTPELTKRYFPDWLLRAFDKDSRARASLRETGTVEGDTRNVDAETILRDAGAIVDDATGEDVALDPAFEAAWRARMERMDDRDTDRDELAELVGVEADQLSMYWHGEAFVARLDGRWLGQWESRPAFVADMAASRELAGRYRGWEDLPLSYRSQVLGGLRLCLTRCPVCDGEVSLGQDVVESCCRTYDVVAATCSGCDARLFEAEYDAAMLNAT
ncbi:MAG: hypothetical protein ACQETI_03605 [Halobacteriota archaeon]